MAPLKTQLKLFASEFVGTAILLLVGLSFVIFNWGEGSITAKLIPSAPARRLLTGFLFGSTGCAIALSPIGKISGAHINPSVSIAFWLRGKMRTYAMLGYVASQLFGAIAGSIPLVLWLHQGKSIDYGNTVPGNAGLLPAFVGEVITTSLLIIVIFVFVGSKKLRNYTPFAMPVLFCLMVWAEAVYSGCSTNAARSLGPAVISGNYTALWLYFIAPVTAAVLVVGAFKLLRLHKYYHIEAARMSFHDRHSPNMLKSN